LNWLLRVAFLATAAALAGMLVVAAVLRPDPRGYGTHEQMGLPPCSFDEVFQVRCPSCGMTTAWSHTVRGQLIAALKANAAGAVLALSAILALPWFAWAGVAGVWPRLTPPAWTSIVLLVVVLGLALTDFAIRLAMR